MNAIPSFALILCRVTFYMARTAMLRAMRAYVEMAPVDEIDDEIEATGRAMRKMQVVAR